MTDFPSSPVSEGLEPCPVCRSRLVSLFERQEGLFVVSCENDDCHFGVEAMGSSAKDAVRQWNHRFEFAQRQQEPVAYRVKFKGDASWTLYYSDPRRHPDDSERLGLVAVEPLFALADTSTLGNSK